MIWVKGAKRYDECLVVACDMPFISSALARYICQKVEGYDIVVPRHRLYLQPLFAIYRKSCIGEECSKMIEAKAGRTPTGFCLSV